MFAIEVDGEFLDLRADQKMRLKLRGQIFYRDFVAAGYTYPFNVPYTPRNARRMRFYHRLANVTTFEDIPCRVWLGGVLWKEAVIKYRRFQDGYDIDLQVPEDPSITALRKVTTRDLTDKYDFLLLSPDNNTAGLDALLATFVGTIDDTDVVFPPIRNVGKFAGRKETYLNADLEDPLNANIRPPSEYMNTYTNVFGHPTLEVFFNEFSPCPYLVRVFEKMMALVGRTLTGDVINEPEVRTQVIVGNLLGSVLIDDLGTVSTASSYRYLWMKDVLPPITGLDFLIRMMKRFNAVPIFHNSSIAFRSMNDILADPDYIDLTEFLEPRDQMELENSGGVQLKEQPEGLDKTERAPTVDREKIIATVELPADLAALTPAIGDMAKVLFNASLYKYDDTSGTLMWRNIGLDMGEYSVGDDPKAQDVGVGFVAMASVPREDSPSDNWLVPSMDMILNDAYGDVHRIGQNPTKQLRLLFNRGLQPDSAANTYEMLSNNIYTQAGTAIADVQQREMLAGAGGIYDVRYRKWNEQLMNGRFVKRRLRIPLHTIRSWRWDRKIMLDGNKFLCREKDIELTTTGYGLVTMDLLRLDPALIPRKP